MIEAAFAIPGDLGLPTGGYVYARRVLERFPLANVRLRPLRCPQRFPTQAPRILAKPFAGLGPCPPTPSSCSTAWPMGRCRPPLIAGLKQSIVALVHHPVGLEAGLSATRQRQLIALEMAALALSRRVLVTSHTTLRTLVSDFAVPAGKITVAEPGTERAARARGTASPPSCWPSARSCRVRPMTSWCVRWLRWRPWTGSSRSLAPRIAVRLRWQPSAGPSPRPGSARASRSPARSHKPSWPVTTIAPICL